MFNSDQDHMSSLEERLRAWVPDSGGLDRDRMLFEAARAGGSPRSWKYATAAAVLLAAGLAFGWHHERRQRRALELAFAKVGPPSLVTAVSSQERIAEGPVTAIAIDPTSYLALIRQVKSLEDGASLKPQQLAPDVVTKVRSADLSQPSPLRPHDFDRVISL
jgi:hypothetical protein